jgi:hypothetical protein
VKGPCFVGRKLAAKEPKEREDKEFLSLGSATRGEEISDFRISDFGNVPKSGEGE